VSQVYVFDMTSGLVKIAKRGNKYNVYRLNEIQESYNLYSGKTKYKFVWESSPSEFHNYKPYDEGDVSSRPEIYVESVRRWNPYKIRLMI
jgi:hypothetical protein